MTILINNEQDAFAVDEQSLERIAVDTLRLQNCCANVQIGITLVDDNTIQDLNRKYRNIDRATDVLSFPMIDYSGFEEDPLLFWADSNRARLDTDLLSGEILLGDIVLSIPTAIRNAALYGHRPEREIAYLTVHGMLHLLGYDHEREEDRQRMRSAEEEILSRLGYQRTSVITERLLHSLMESVSSRSSPCISFYCSDDQVRTFCFASPDNLSLDTQLTFPKGVVPLVAAASEDMSVSLPCPLYLLKNDEWQVKEPFIEGAIHG